VAIGAATSPTCIKQEMAARARVATTSTEGAHGGRKRTAQGAPIFGADFPDTDGGSSFNFGSEHMRQASPIQRSAWDCEQQAAEVNNTHTPSIKKAVRKRPKKNGNWSQA